MLYNQVGRVESEGDVKWYLCYIRWQAVDDTVERMMGDDKKPQDTDTAGNLIVNRYLPPPISDHS